MVRVNVEGLVKQYDRVAVVDGASLELPSGALTVVVGPSGAGKTTLARLIAGLETLDDGEIFFDAAMMHNVPASERRVGMVFQDDALFPRMTVAENVGYAARVAGLSRAERRDKISEALNALRIDSLAPRSPSELSVTQRRRVALARALAAAPTLLILDDPLGRLDTRARDEMREELLRLHRENRLTTLVLTAEPRDACALADRLAVMDLGKIVQAGAPETVYNRPADAFVARFLGPINLVEGQVESLGNRGEVIVRTPLGRLIGQNTAPAPADLPVGSAVTLSIRPEALAFGSNVPTGSNRFPATVARLLWLGEVRQVHLRAPGGWSLIATALQSQTQNLRDGQNVTLSVPPEQVVVLPGKYAGPH